MQLVDHDIIKDRLLKFIDETPYKETLVDERDPSTKWGSRISKCDWIYSCLLYTSPSPRDYAASRMPSSA